MSRPMDEEEPSLLLVVLDASCTFWTKREANRRRQEAVRIFHKSPNQIYERALRSAQYRAQPATEHSANKSRALTGSK